LEKIDPFIAAKHGLKLFPAGTVLFAKSGMSATKGHIYALRNEAYVVNHLAALVPRKPADSAFLMHALQRFPPTTLVKDPAYPSIRLGDIEEMPIFAPIQLDERKRIAAILDQADALRRKRHEGLKKLDRLKQSIFSRNFGSGPASVKGYPKSTLGAVTTKVSDGPHVSPSYVEDGVPFVSTRNIRRDGMDWTDMKFISVEDAERQWKKIKPQRGDLLYTKGGTTGIAKAVDFDGDFTVWVHVAVLKLKSDVVDPVWLESCLNNDECYRQSQVLTKGIANRDLGLKRMIGIVFHLPPIEEQWKFVKTIEAHSKVVAQFRNQEDALKSLFASLQHRAFRGEL
jgi:type I restriction enzyme S subunit